MRLSTRSIASISASTRRRDTSSLRSSCVKISWSRSPRLRTFPWFSRLRRARGEQEFRLVSELPNKVRRRHPSIALLNWKVRTTANLSSVNMQLQFYQVRYFLALARTLNFTRAAEQCNVTQPALTKAVQKLEQELGGALIHRERHLIQLTELGNMVLPTLEKIFAAAEAVRLQARGYQKKTIAPLKIGLVPSVSAALITELLLELASVIPDLRVDLREADASGLVAMLLDGEINAALVGDAVELPERIDRWPLFEERCVLVLSQEHPMARQTVIPPQDLHEVVFLERLGCDVAGRFKDACFADCPGPKLAHRSDQERHLQQM